ncbi:MAG: SPFH domain-containing protein [Anaerolineales bacterium]
MQEALAAIGAGRYAYPLLIAGFGSTLMAVIIGYLLARRDGSLIFGGGSFFVFFFYIGIQIILPALNLDTRGQTVIFVILLLLAAPVAYGAGKTLYRTSRAGVAFGSVWLFFVALFFIGHSLAGNLGVALITLPAMLLFWSTLLLLAARYILPLENRKQIYTAMRALLTYTVGAHLPYYVVQDRRMSKRHSGKTAGKRFTGPGIVLTEPDQTVAVWDGLQLMDIPPPGLIFIHRFEKVQEIFDLRPQHRFVTTRAITADGIPLKVGTFMRFRIDAGEQEPRLGAPYPFRRSAAFKALRAGMIEIHREGSGYEEIEHRAKQSWEAIVPRTAQYVLRNVLADYRFDELSQRYWVPQDEDNPQKVRAEIQSRFRRELEEEVRDWGIQIQAAGFGNLDPAMEEIGTTRIENWRVLWARKILGFLSKSEAKALMKEAKVRTGTYVELVNRVSDLIKRGDVDEAELAANIIIMRFTDAVQEIIGDPMVRRSLPGDVVQTLSHIERIANGEESNESEEHETE